MRTLTVEDLLAAKHPHMPAGSANVSLEPKQAKSARTDRRRNENTDLIDSTH